MSILRLLIPLALLTCCSAGDAPVVAQTTPAMAPPGAQDTTVKQPIVFYLAHGDKNACGPGCSDWIAAEGEIVPGNGNQLQRLLVRLNGIPLPIFFNSPGGNVMTSIALGRLIRARQFAVSIGRTLPLDCNFGATGETSCEAKISAGQPIKAELDPDAAMCNSACVYAFAGGTVRLIPPGVALGIHDMGLEREHPNWPAQYFDAVERRVKVSLHEYMHSMGIDDQLLSEAFAIPNTSLKRLSRDEAARFGLDRREFGESAWHFLDKPSPTIRKVFFVRIHSEPRRYVDGLVKLSCGKGLGAKYVLTFARDLLPGDPSVLSVEVPVSIRVSDKQFSLSGNQDPKFYRRSTQLAPSVLDGIADVPAIVLPGIDFGGENGPADDVTLTMNGFSTAYAELRKACA
ncbi:MAG TPA: hypothetical protein VMA30_21655 [Xanthobacteraceae bacterium]|nr:hypothetical protein [Xanthobacteraceae bacterium]